MHVNITGSNYNTKGKAIDKKTLTESIEEYKFLQKNRKFTEKAIGKVHKIWHQLEQAGWRATDIAKKYGCKRQAVTQALDKFKKGKEGESHD